MDSSDQTFGQYQLVELIHQGENSVYKGFQPSMNRYVAVKILSPAKANDPAFVQQFQRDMQLIVGLDHPNILPVYDYGQQDGLLYMVTRYVETGTVKDHLPRYHRLEDAERLINDIAGALDYIHSRGTLHGNLKPSNILVDERDQPLLTDFGYTQGIDVGAGENVYLSPELAQGGQYDQRTDTYALGVLLYEMVVGAPPPLGTTPNPRAQRPDLPAEVERVILKAMAQYPDQRYQTAGELNAALQAAATPKPQQDNSRLLIWGGVALIALLAIAACALLFFFGFYNFLFGSDAGDQVAAGTPVSGGVIIILPTPAPGAPSVTALTNVNIRTGPGTQYPRIGILPAGQSVEVVGVSSDGGWWAINVPPEAIKVSYLDFEQNQGAPDPSSAFARGKVRPRRANAYNGNGWVSAEYVEAQNTENVPIIQPPPVPTPTAAPPVEFIGWRGEYFDNRDLQGNPVLVRDDPRIDFSWGLGSPGPGVPADNFSARWTISR